MLCCMQSEFESVDEGELKKMDGTVTTLTKELQDLQSECKIQETGELSLAEMRGYKWIECVN